MVLVNGLRMDIRAELERAYGVGARTVCGAEVVNRLVNVKGDRKACAGQGQEGSWA
jgi:hypothetical protein